VRIRAICGKEKKNLGKTAKFADFSLEKRNFPENFPWKNGKTKKF